LVFTIARITAEELMPIIFSRQYVGLQTQADHQGQRLEQLMTMRSKSLSMTKRADPALNRICARSAISFAARESSFVGSRTDGFTERDVNSSSLVVRFSRMTDLESHTVSNTHDDQWEVAPGIRVGERLFEFAFLLAPLIATGGLILLLGLLIELLAATGSSSIVTPAIAVHH
jgi:hypothetical protein